MKKAIGLLLLAANLSGCGTLMGWKTLGPSPYHGVRTDAVIIRGGESSSGSYNYAPTEPTPLLRALCIFDIPFSMVLDTVLLPYTIPFGR